MDNHHDIFRKMHFSAHESNAKPLKREFQHSEKDVSDIVSNIFKITNDTYSDFLIRKESKLNLKKEEKLKIFRNYLANIKKRSVQAHNNNSIPIKKSKPPEAKVMTSKQLRSRNLVIKLMKQRKVNKNTSDQKNDKLVEKQEVDKTKLNSKESFLITQMNQDPIKNRTFQRRSEKSKTVCYNSRNQKKKNNQMIKPITINNDNSDINRPTTQVKKNQLFENYNSSARLYNTPRIMETSSLNTLLKFGSTLNSFESAYKTKFKSKDRKKENLYFPNDDEIEYITRLKSKEPSFFKYMLFTRNPNKKYDTNISFYSQSLEKTRINFHPKNKKVFSKNEKVSKIINKCSESVHNIKNTNKYLQQKFVHFEKDSKEALDKFNLIEKEKLEEIKIIRGNKSKVILTENQKGEIDIIHLDKNNVFIRDHYANAIHEEKAFLHREDIMKNFGIKLTQNDRHLKINNKKY